MIDINNIIGLIGELDHRVKTVRNTKFRVQKDIKGALGDLQRLTSTLG